MLIMLAAAVAIVLGLISGFVAWNKGHRFWQWWAFGAVLFPVAMPLALRLRPTARVVRTLDLDRVWEEYNRECPACHDNIRSTATACPYCHAKVMPTRKSASEVLPFRTR